MRTAFVEMTNDKELMIINDEHQRNDSRVEKEKFSFVR